MDSENRAPASFGALRTEISARHPEMSQRLRQVAEYALENPNDMALETVATIATRAGVQPSTLIRFAKTMGFDGFTDMQRLFRTHLLDRQPIYAERLRALETEGGSVPDGASGVLDHFIEAGTRALAHLRHEIRPEALERAVDLLAGAEHVYIIGQRRSFPVASYFAYALSHLGRRMYLLDGVGGLLQQQLRTMGAEDVLLAISFKPYAPETVEACRQAVSNSVPLLAITDTALSPLVPLATVALEVEEAQVKGFRSLAATMCLAVSMVVALGRRLERQGRQPALPA
jgi:DNA-binding MurR/RpiR family transcriptional regulator